MISALMRTYLKGTGFQLIESMTAKAGLNAVIEQRPDLVLLDLTLPDGEGIDLLTTIRQWSRTPVIVISARLDDQYMARVLDAGADDYVTKPFSMVELLARMRVAARHLELRGAAEPVFESGSLSVDYALRLVTLNGHPIKLSPLEYRLLSVLVKHSGKVVTHRQLLAEVWGEEYTDEAQYLRVYMGYLRKKLEPESSSPKLILTEHRVGYRLAV